MGKGEYNTAEVDLEVVILLSLLFFFFFFYNIIVIIRGAKQDEGLSVHGTFWTGRTERGTLVMKSSKSQ